jgi:predicted PhzF superfamily epimerase YddE/YHI9
MMTRSPKAALLEKADYEKEPSMKLYQIDAFANEVFRGNPAAVVPLDNWLPEDKMQAIASENNLPETAFFVPDKNDFALRWFTPTQEVPLCGHATLASAFVVFTEIDSSLTTVRFQTLSGLLTVSRSGDTLQMDFPKHDLVPTDAPPALRAGLPLPPCDVYKTLDNPNYYAVYDTEAQIRALAPDFARLQQLDLQGVVVTAPGDDADFVSRYFAPRLGIPEDPVTGSIHCALVPYWAARLGKTALHARQVSRRGGELFCENGAERVRISGSAVKYLEGELFI